MTRLLTRFKWMEARRKELEQWEPISPERKEQVKVEARSSKEGLKYVERPAKGAFTAK